MISLVIDTSISIPTISIIEDNLILYKYNKKIDSDMSSKILTILDEGMRISNYKLNNIDKIFVVNGPGSFTGIRIGITIVKTLAYALKKEVITLSSLEFMASTKADYDYIVPMIDARRGNVFGAIYDRNLNCIKEACLIKKEELLSNINNNYLLVSYDNIANSIIPEPDIIRIVNKHLNDLSVNPHELKPNYLKLTEAEENRLKSD